MSSISVCCSSSFRFPSTGRSCTWVRFTCCLSCGTLGRETGGWTLWCRVSILRLYRVPVPHLLYRSVCSADELKLENIQHAVRGTHILIVRKSTPDKSRSDLPLQNDVRLQPGHLLGTSLCRRSTRRGSALERSIHTINAPARAPERCAT